MIVDRISVSNFDKETLENVLAETSQHKVNWIDRFENDDLPDYPYKKAHWGYNAHAAAQITPEIKFTLGRLSERKRKTDEENRPTFGIVTLEKDMRGRGRVRLFDMLRLAKDDIPDLLFQGVVDSPEFGNPGEDSGHHERIVDPLGARATWINTLYADWDYQNPRRWRTFHRFKWEFWSQREDTEGRRTSGFFGFIDKLEYRHYWGRVTISPKIKSEFLREVPFDRALDKRRSWDGLLFLQVGFPVLRTTKLELGLEQRFFHDLTGDEDQLAARQRTGDFRGTVLAVQLTNPASISATGCRHRSACAMTGALWKSSTGTGRSGPPACSSSPFSPD